MIGSFCFWLYGKLKKQKLRNCLLRIVFRVEGGQMLSSTARQIMLFYHDVKIGLYSYGCFNSFNIRPGVKIGRYCSFGREVMIFDANHPITFCSTHPYFYEPQYGYVKENLVVQTEKEIGNDVWIGHRVMIMPKCRKIGDGAILGAGSVVTKDVPPYAIVAGNPAKIIGYRFDEEKVAELLESKWWLKDMSMIETSIGDYTKDLFCD